MIKLSGAGNHGRNGRGEVIYSVAAVPATQDVDDTAASSRGTQPAVPEEMRR